jgi:hypothetical protein
MNLFFVITSYFINISLKVFYVPLRNEYGENGHNTNQDLTKRFDEDLSNKHLIVVSIINLFFFSFLLN